MLLRPHLPLLLLLTASLARAEVPPVPADELAALRAQLTASGALAPEHLAEDLAGELSAERATTDLARAYWVRVECASAPEAHFFWVVLDAPTVVQPIPDETTAVDFPGVPEVRDLDGDGKLEALYEGIDGADMVHHHFSLMRLVGRRWQVLWSSGDLLDGELRIEPSQALGEIRLATEFWDERAKTAFDECTMCPHLRRGEHWVVRGRRARRSSSAMVTTRYARLSAFVAAVSARRWSTARGLLDTAARLGGHTAAAGLPQLASLVADGGCSMIAPDDPELVSWVSGLVKLPEPVHAEVREGRTIAVLPVSDEDSRTWYFGCGETMFYAQFDGDERAPRIIRLEWLPYG